MKLKMVLVGLVVVLLLGVITAQILSERTIPLYKEDLDIVNKYNLSDIEKSNIKCDKEYCWTNLYKEGIINIDVKILREDKTDKQIEDEIDKAVESETLMMIEHWTLVDKNININDKVIVDSEIIKFDDTKKIPVEEPIEEEITP